MASTRDQFIATMSTLLESQGYHATGINQIIKDSGSPKGSLYYYFPDGKDGLTAEAIAHSGRTVVARMRDYLAGEADAATAIPAVIAMIATQVELSGFSAGGPLTIVAMETATSNERLNSVCRAAYTQLQEVFAQKLRESGYSEARAHRLATFIIAAIEGGIILSRTWHSGDPLRCVAEEIGLLLASTAVS